MKYQRWTVAQGGQQARETLEQAGLSPLLSAVLAARGVETPEQAAKLFAPEWEPLADPMAMADMDKAVARVRLAIERRERVAVFGDYDVDGITATCLLTEVLRGEGLAVIPYIPCRLEEGYGLNREAVSALAGQGVTLIVTVDCGITAVDETEFARTLGVDVVITDHHACQPELPRAAAVVDPCRPDCPYPFKGLAGVGVALKLAMAVTGRAQAILEEYCDLAAVGTVADVMPMTGENRHIVSRGLAALNPPRRLGLAELIRSAAPEERAVNSVFIGYTLAPRINASGRLGRAMEAVELLLTQDGERAQTLAQELCQLNRERQAIESEIFQQSIQRLERHPQSGVVVLADPSWHQGVVGIVASRLAERCGCPTFMICLDRGVGKGSCRSWGGVNLFALLQACSPLLENFGGHAMAAGFTVREENIPALARALREQLALREEPPVSQLEADAEIEARMLTVGAVESLERLEPWGTGNPRPLLVLRGARVQTLCQVGQGRHLKLRLESRGTVLDAICFSTDGSQLGLCPDCRVDVAFYPQINDFRGQRSVQLQVVDLCPAPTRAQMERAIYEKFCREEPLTQEEARFLLPERQEFVDLWRYLERHSGGGATVEDTLVRIARGVSRSAGQREIPARTRLCLEVLEERGLITLSEHTGRIQITIRQVEQKVDLEASLILRRLRSAVDGR